MTAADRNTAADAPLPVDVIANELRVQSGQAPLRRPFGERAEQMMTALDAAGYDVVARTPDTPTTPYWVVAGPDGTTLRLIDGPDTPTTARALRDANLPHVRQVITDLLAERDAAVAQMEAVVEAMEALLEATAALDAERDAAVARADALEQRIDQTFSYLGNADSMADDAVTLERCADLLDDGEDAELSGRLNAVAATFRYLAAADRGTDR